MVTPSHNLTNAQLVSQSVAHMEAFRAHPHFLPATERLARGFVQLYKGNRLLNRILNDRGRMIFGQLVQYLDATPDESGVGLTVTRIANLCQELGVCSRGRAKALVVLMRWAGYLDVGAQTGPNRRQRPLVPTARLAQEQLKRWRQAYAALSMLHPPAEEVLARIEDPAFARVLMREMGRRFVAGLRLLNYAPELTVFAERDAGVLIAMSLLTSGAEGDAFPPERPVPMPVAGLARQFFVSRAHVLKLMREAEARSLIERTPSATGSVLLLAPLRMGIVNVFAVIFSLFADSGDSALAFAATQAGDFKAASGERSSMTSIEPGPPPHAF